MKNRKLTLQNIAIFIVIIVTFMGNALFFATLNTDSLRQSVEAETELSASVYANHLMERISLEDILAQRFQGDESQLFQDVGASEETDVWVIAPDGAVYSKNGESASGNLFDGSEEFSAELVQQAEQDGVSILWQGKKSILFLRQSCCAVRPIYGGRLFLVVVNHCLSAQAIQRRQLSLMFMIDTVLVFTTIVLIANIIFNYRRLLIRLATTDELTCLANRKSFNTEFEEFMEQGEGQECSLFLLDIDLFKQINDNYGHAAGDHALSYLAQEIQSMVKENHGFAGRWGGDEFIGILPLSGIEAHKQLKKLCRTIADAHLEEGFRMTISAGVASADGDTNLGKISERADLALYHSKENGRNSATLYDLSMEVPEELTAKQADAPAAQRPAPEAQRTQTDSAAPKRSPVGEGGVKGSLRSRLTAYVREKLVQSSILGVTWMAPFVAGGGILIALAFLFDAASVKSDSDSEIRRKRLHFGLVFQSFNLFPQYTTLQNVMLAKQLLAREQPDFKSRKKEIYNDIEHQARRLLIQMGLADRMTNYPHQLSGGQQQRVAIARALALEPDILCFDEPTSALDPELTGEVLRVIRELADRKTTMIIVTHEMAFARDVASQVIFMDNGYIVEQGDPVQVIEHPREERTRQFLAHYAQK